ncbi:MAG: LPS export ABC transporter periplasmic protein LptC [Fidelibacterota bacterium]
MNNCRQKNIVLSVRTGSTHNQYEKWYRKEVFNYHFNLMKICCIFILFSFMILSCDDSKPILEDGISSSDLIANLITNPKIIISKGDIINIKAISDRMEKGNNQKAMLIGNVRADIYNELGEHVSIMTSDTAEVNESSNNLEAFGHVIVESDSGLTLRTQRLLWDNRYKIITSDEHVMFTTQEMDTLYGVGFTSDIDLSHWKILKPTGVTGRVF